MKVACDVRGIFIRGQGTVVNITGSGECLHFDGIVKLLDAC